MSKEYSEKLKDPMPHPTRRRWIKLWTQESLYGSISKELEPGERWAWIGLLLMAGDSMANGVVCAAPDVPYSDEQIAKILALPLNDWQTAKTKMLQYNKIEVNGAGGLKIVNWDKYQAFDKEGYQKEYMRAVRQNVRQNVSLTKTLTDTKPEAVRLNVRQDVSLQEEEGRGGEEEEDTSSKKDMSSSSKRGLGGKESALIKGKLQKLPYGQFSNVYLTTGEYQKLKEKFGEGLSERIEYFSERLESKGYKYKSHYATILNWERMEQRKGANAKPLGRHPADRVPDHYTTPEELDAAEHDL